ncbi:hypothetical protein ABZV60_15020 [Streptomyces sp. NPDC004787]|uniref:hypothetical protein n=1 Tax=Streptomyces sp. NPDC004787 TaxID=3154291 RepID=UPI0033AF7550
MGHARAYPVFRSDDADAAYARARELCRGLEEVRDGRWLEALVGEPGRVREVAGVVPGALFEGADGEPYDPWAEGGRAVAPPVWVFEEEAPADAELPFLQAVGQDPAVIGWRGRWPGADGAAQYDGVQVSFRSDEVEPDAARPADTHTVFLHVDKRCPPDRVRHLAARAGCRLLGEARTGW